MTSRWLPVPALDRLLAILKDHARRPYHDHDLKGLEKLLCTLTLPSYELDGQKFRVGDFTNLPKVSKSKDCKTAKISGKLRFLVKKRSKTMAETANATSTSGAEAQRGKEEHT